MPDVKSKRHLPRLRHVWKRDPVYFVTTCTFERRALLAHPLAHAILLEEWRGMSARCGWKVGRYVIMPDHVHFFVAPAGDPTTTLGVAVGFWKTWTSHALRRAMDLEAPVWERQFFDHLLRSDESRAEKWNYVRENPVRAGLVNDASAWPYAGAVDFD